MGWWGAGPSPAERWPAATIDIQANRSTHRKRWETIDGRFFYDQVAADRAVEFFPAYLRHHIGHFAGHPFDLLPYQELLIVRALFGWKSVATGLRRFRKVFAFLPKGSGKSPLAAGIGFYLAFCCNEAAAEVYAVAAEKGQARIIHDNARIMAETIKKDIDPELGDLLLVKRDEIERIDNHSKYIVLSADAASKHGFRPSAVLMDEMHAQKNRDLYEVLWRSMIKRLEPVMLITTHAGHDDEGICYEEYDLAKRVRAGDVDDPTLLPVIFEATPEQDPFIETTWRKVNPGHGITIQHDAIVSLAQEAKDVPRKRNDFQMWHLNRWVNQAVAWLPVDWWDACSAPMPSDAELATWPCAAGMDLAQKIDLAAFVMVFRQRIASSQTISAVGTVGEARDEAPITKSLDLNYRIAIKAWFWIPEETMRDHERNDRVPYSQWARDGLVTPTDGVSIDYTKVYRDITQSILPKFPKLRASTIGYDPAFATDLATALRGFSGRDDWCVEVPQNYRFMSEPMYIFEALVKSGNVIHGGNRLMRNHVENVAVKADDAMRLRPRRPRKASKHIDGLVGALMGLRQLAAVPERRSTVGMFVV